MATKSERIMGIDETPPWYMTVLLAVQHFLTSFGAMVGLNLLVTSKMCFGDDVIGRSEIFGASLFVSGLSSFLQTTIGSRLPIIQGPSAGFLAAILAILDLQQWTCPAYPDLFTEGGDRTNTTVAAYVNVTGTLQLYGQWRRGLWGSRIAEISGAVAVSGVLEIVLGATGLVGLVLNYIGPLAVCPTVFLMAFSLFTAIADLSATHWAISILTMFLVILFSQYLSWVTVPCWRPAKSGTTTRKLACTKAASVPIFESLPVILAIVIAWALCHVLTVTEVLPNDPGTVGYWARTDVKSSVLSESPWFRFPYPGQLGWPTVNSAAVVGMFAAVIAVIIESVGDYYACARAAAAPQPRAHAVNRGILVQGIGTVLCGLWGTGHGLTSFSENVAAISLTKVGSRRVLQLAAIFMMLLGVFGKFNAIFVTIPDPIIGGIFMITFSLITSISISILQFANLNSSRNLFVFGFAIFFGFSVPQWLKAHPGYIKTGSAMVDQVLTLLLTTNMFVGGALAIFLDNTFPGSDEERGLTKWRAETSGATFSETADSATTSSTYDLPLVTRATRALRFTRYVPFWPHYDDNMIKCTRCHSRKVKRDVTVDSSPSVPDQSPVYITRC